MKGNGTPAKLTSSSARHTDCVNARLPCRRLDDNVLLLERRDMPPRKAAIQKEPTLPPNRALRAIAKQLEALQTLKGRKCDEADADETEWLHLTRSIIEGAFGNPSSALSNFYMAR